jgi:hypothetical protein
MTATEIAGIMGAGLSGAAYVPQIAHLIRAHCSAGLSRPAYHLWLLASVLLAVRAVATRADVFIVLSGIQILATTTVLYYSTLYEDKACPLHATLDGHIQPSGARAANPGRSTAVDRRGLCYHDDRVATHEGLPSGRRRERRGPTHAAQGPSASEDTTEKDP